MAAPEVRARCGAMARAARVGRAAQHQRVARARAHPAARERLCPPRAGVGVPAGLLALTLTLTLILTSTLTLTLALTLNPNPNQCLTSVGRIAGGVPANAVTLGLVAGQG